MQSAIEELEAKGRAAKFCVRCGSSQGLQHHHIIPKALAKKAGPDYWNLFSSTKFIGCEPPKGFQEAADRWTALPHKTQLLCADCAKQVHKEIRDISKRIRQAQQSKCQCFECQFFRSFDLGNLYSWFAPEQ
jgi:hypothetical protein